MIRHKLPTPQPCPKCGHEVVCVWHKVIDSPTVEFIYEFPDGTTVPGSYQNCDTVVPVMDPCGCEITRVESRWEGEGDGRRMVVELIA